MNGSPLFTGDAGSGESEIRRWILESDWLDHRRHAGATVLQHRHSHRFDDKGWGQFHFGYVHGQMDCRLTTRDGEPAVEWTWDGNDEMDPAQGRGWAVVKGNELHGMIFFRGGDGSEFVARKKAQRPKKPKT